MSKKEQLMQVAGIIPENLLSAALLALYRLLLEEEEREAAFCYGQQVTSLRENHPGLCGGHPSTEGNGD